jgi:predicted nucleic acid-binding protein
VPIDTDVLIWMTRGHAGAVSLLQTLQPWRISAVTCIELVQGCRNKREMEQIKQGLAMCGTQVLPIREAISDRAIFLIERHALSNGLLLADALIAATALEHGMPLLTGNVKHFSPVEGLDVKAFAA